MCVLSVKVPIRKKSGNLFNDPRIYPAGLVWFLCLTFVGYFRLKLSFWKSNSFTMKHIAGKIMGY